MVTISIIFPLPETFIFDFYECLMENDTLTVQAGFALLLGFLIFPITKKITFIDVLIGVIGISCCLYIYFFYDDLINRGGVLYILNMEI